MNKWIRKLSDRCSRLAPPVRASIIYTLCSVLQQGISFIAVPIYTRLTSSEQYGIYTLYQSWDQVLIIFATLNMWNYLFSSGMIKYEDRKEDFTSALLGLNLLLTSGILIVFLFLKKWYFLLSGLPVIVPVFMFVDFYLRPGYEYWSARQRFEYDVKKFAIAAVTISVTTPLVSIGAISLLKYIDYPNVGVALVFGKIFCAGVIYLIVNVGLIGKSKRLYDREIWRFALRFNLPLIPHFLSTVLLAQTDKLMIGSMIGKPAAAICGIAHSVTAVMLIVNTAMMNSIVPWTYRRFRDNDYAKIPFVSAVTLAAVAGMNILAALCAPEIIAIMAPEAYAPATYLVPPMVISNVFMFMFNFYANVEYYHEKTKLVAVASCLSALANVALNYVFIPIYGFVAAGYTTLACYVLYALFHFIFMRRVIREKGITERIYNNKVLWGIGAAAAAISLLVIRLYPYPLIRWGFLAVCIAAAVIFRKKIISLIKMLKT